MCVSYSKSIQIALKDCHGSIFFSREDVSLLFSFAVCILILTVPEKIFAPCTVPTDVASL